MSHSVKHDQAIEILETRGAFDCEEFLAGKVSVSELKLIVSENTYDRYYRGIKNIAFEQCLANVYYA